ncbi:hypothetical protein OG331_40365 [Streptomyces sp. NBC_01017]|uniref:hypothetical protein n=1 Tax=Streptomyces sp. NBC_01017 TaxID=2903721 RepID=UPI00386CB74F|nr:hypothetical protein OG331_40365 [Streptomyces sp. NBC_01017]
MNGNPAIHWTGIAVSTVLVLPLSVAMLFGWAPRLVGERASMQGIRLWGVGMLLIYSTALINGFPRLADASQGVVMTATVAGGAVGVTGALLFLVADLADKRARRSPK